MPSDLLNRLQRILVFADKVADKVVCEETDILEKTIPRMYEVMYQVAELSCNYVKRGRLGRWLSFPDLAGADRRRENNERASLARED